MPMKRLASNAHRLVLTATPRQVTLRVTLPANTPSAAKEATLNSINLSLNCETPSKPSSFLDDLNKPTPEEPYFAHFLRDRDAVAVKKDAKAVVPQQQHEPSNSATSIKHVNKQEEKPANTPTAPAAVESNAAKASVIRNVNNDTDGLEGFTAREVLKLFNSSILETFPHLNKAIIEWYDIVGLPKEPLHPWKGYLGVPEFGLPGKMAKSLSGHVGKRYLEWMNRV